MKTTLLLFSFFLLAISGNAQMPTYTTSYNMNSSATAISPQQYLNKSLRVRFDVQNDTIVLIDSFITGQVFVDSFTHTAFSADTVVVDYLFMGMMGSSNSCSPHGDIDSIYRYAFKLFHKDSFQNKVIQYKEHYYSHTDLGTTNWAYTPKQYDVSEHLIISFHGQAEFYMNQECPVSIYVSNDSIFIQSATNGLNLQLLRENMYSTPDSFNLHVQYPCGNPIPLLMGFQCNKIYIGDTSVGPIDVKMTSINSSHPTLGASDYWFHYDSPGSTSIYNAILGPLAVEGFELTEVKRFAGYNQILWQTITEENTDYFSVLKSTDGNSFKNIALVKAAGVSNFPTYYSFDDNQTSPSDNVYYQIAAHDIDGKKVLSNIFYVSGKGKEKIIVSPNPSNGRFTIQGLNGDNHLIKITSLDGRVVYQKNVEHNNDMKINLSDFSKGIYILSVQNLATNLTNVERIVLEN